MTYRPLRVPVDLGTTFWIDDPRAWEDLPVPTSGTRWFLSYNDATEYADTLDQWVISSPFGGLWRVEELDGKRE